MTFPFRSIEEWNKCLYIKSEAYHDFAGKSVGTCEITGKNMANLLRSNYSSNLTKALTKNIGVCTDNIIDTPILTDDTSSDQITNLTFNNLNPTPPDPLVAINPTLPNPVKVQSIGTGREFLKDLSLNTWNTLNVNTKSGVINVNVFKLTQATSTAGSNPPLVKGAYQYGTQITQIFNHCIAAPPTTAASPTAAANINKKKHIFFVVDTGDTIRNKILKKIKLSHSDTDTERIFIHTIHCNETLGDSASKSKPDSKDFSYKIGEFTDQNKFFCLSWLYSSTVNEIGASTKIIGSTDRLPITSYNITLDRKAGWQIEGKWEQPENTTTDKFIPTYGNGSYQPFIAKEQKISAMIKEMQEYFTATLDPPINIANFFFNPMTTDDKLLKQVGSFYQRKRSGDYLQIDATDKLGNYLINLQYSTENKFQLIRPNEPPTLPTASIWGDFTDFYPYTTDKETFPINKCFDLTGQPLNERAAQVKKNIFFVTGDYPALDYALYNKINVIFSPPPGGSIPSNIWVFHFH